MKFLRAHIGLRLVWLFLAMHILNCSIDAPDPQPDYVPEDLSFNDIESIAEAILENVLHLDNAIAEYDEKDAGDGSEEQTFKKGVDFSYYPVRLEFSLCKLADIQSNKASFRDNLFSQFTPELTPPPPRA